MSSLIFSYLIAITLLTITPGLDTTLIVRTATIESRSKAFQTVLGINFGCMVWGLIVAVGVGAIILASDLAFMILKWLGAIYLAWLGLNMLMNPRYSIATQRNTIGQTNWFMRGFLGNLLNPKVGVFYISFLPQFIPPHASVIYWMIGLVSIHIILGITWSLFLIYMVDHIKPYLRNSRFIKYMDQLTGCIFLIFAVKLFLAKR